MILNIKSVHPFPARMAPSIIWDRVPDNNPPLRILDPMAGSGTTLVVARSKGHIAYGVDRDPLAVMIAKASCIDINKSKLLSKATEVLEKAKKTAKTLTSKTAYPNHADDETKDFIRYWFDLRNRKQLVALSMHISNVRDQNIKILLWTAFSRMIITKKIGVSLAMDISHSRPHRVYDRAPIKPFDKFETAVNMLLKSAHFEKGKQNLPNAHVLNSDARSLPLADNSVDIVITSPPYLNAIDYLRGHKFSLLWMGHSIKKIRRLRSTNIGAEVLFQHDSEKEQYSKALVKMGRIEELADRTRSILLKYVYDMNAVMSEIKRVLTKNGRAVFVIGDSTIRGVFVKNSKLIKHLANKHGFLLQSATRRRLPEKHRYLPPPNHKKSGIELQRRMREEVILAFQS